MTPGSFATVAPGAAGQLAALAAGLVGAVLVTAAVLLLAWWRGRGRQGATGAPVSVAAGTRPDAASLLGAALLLVVLLPAAVAVRQLWLHPALGSRLALVWLLVALVAGIAMLGASRRRGDEDRPDGGAEP
jgi:hypothetical protein